MKVLRWFVGQVERLRRSIVDAFAPDPDAERRGRADEHFVSTDQPAAGPPEDWVERVRRGAPGLLEPSPRRQGEPTGPMDERIVLSQTELEPQPGSLEEPEREYAPPRQPVGPRRPEAPARARLWRKVMRGRRSSSAVPPSAVDASSAPTADHMARELHAATRRARESADSPAGERLDRRRLVGESEPTPTRPTPPEAGRPERSPRPTEVVEFEAPAQRLAARVERAARPDRPSRASVARQSAENAPGGELAVDELRTDRGRERTLPVPEPRRESSVERLREPDRSTSRQESSLDSGPPRRSRAEPLSAGDPHPWPELPPPLDQVDGDVEAALRAWEHQRRVDREQTRL